MTELSAAVDDQSIMFKGTLENQKIPSFSFRKKYQNFAKTTYNVWPPFKKVPVLEKNETIAWTREGVQSSSNSNHRHPNLFCGKRAPQLVISTTSSSNHPQKA